jgi:hypothetical protein
LVLYQIVYEKIYRFHLFVFFCLAE